ncbi:hypothetical protein RCF98_07030 [Thiothrix lacustris]|jgi:hypothetical protein|uniref:Lipoprotein n=1 Tax=Thiothrix lacustris TaxID=525917 RepID=A0ABY9MWS2_9GAMM|nr:hypothetical protein [Thiothrix lacustris]WML92090.1 hypothetical protein RCF98_07030 [Thiothrix lacustris]
MKKKLIILMLSTLAVSTSLQADDCIPYVTGLFEHDDYHQDSFMTVNGLRIYHDGKITVPSRPHITHGFSSPTDYADKAVFTMDYKFFIDNPDYDAIAGQFQDVFLERDGEDNTDLTTLVLERSGRVKLRLNDHAGQEYYLTDLNCHGENRDRFVLRGKVSDGPYRSTWVFALSRFVIPH